ncbi:hypothetical protein ACQ4PT_065291 [Festuca glaucescens]
MAQWWGEWELRVLVLASLSAQYFLVLFAGVRKFHIPPWMGFSFRLAHIGSDALAIFALATLFNREKNGYGTGCRYARANRDLELFWAPILLMHLGGQVAITTYKIEDNEQWSRHIITSLSKVTVALYVLYKSWSSNDKRLLAATILLFILVIMRCLQKALDLKNSSFNALQKASSSEKNVVRGTNVSEEGRLQNFIKDARAVVDDGGMRRSPGNLPRLPYQLFLDFPSPYYDRLEILKIFWQLDPDSAYQAIEDALSAMTSFLYTKDRSTHSAITSFLYTKGYRRRYLAFKNAPAGLILRRCTHVLAYATLITAICLVHTSRHKEAYSGEDTRVTLALLYGTLLMELVYLCVRSVFRDMFSGRILQYNLIGSLADKKKWHYLTLRRIAGFLQCRDLLDQYLFHMDPSYSCKEITELVHQHVESGWKGYIRDNESYRRFNDIRGEWTLARKGCHQKLGWSLKRPFDETIILWHLATDLCFFCRGKEECGRRCKQISNYMMHLLFANPEMLMPGSRKRLLDTANNELERILSAPHGERKSMEERVFDRCNAGSTPESFIHDAWELATSLLGDEEAKMWELIQGVWVEMLCFSAGRCRGYLHAERLGTCVEYLSYVWVMLAYAGMETFPEKLQRREGQTVDGYEDLQDEEGQILVSRVHYLS